LAGGEGVMLFGVVDLSLIAPGLSADLLLFVAAAICIPTFLCACCARCCGRSLCRRLDASAGMVSASEHGGAEFCRVHLELQDGRATTLGMRTRQLRSLSIKELASALATAYRTKMRAQAVPPFSICYLDEGGEWEQLTTRTWLDVRDEITDLRVMASAADSPPRFSSSKSARDYSGGYAPVSSR